MNFKQINDVGTFDFGWNIFLELANTARDLLGNMISAQIGPLTYDQTLVFENRELMKGGEEKRL